VSDETHLKTFPTPGLKGRFTVVIVWVHNDELES